MISVKNQLHEVYYNESRDFQLIGRIFECLLNYCKMSIDSTSETPYSDNLNTKLSDLLCTTLGFESKHIYNVNDLMALGGGFSTILRNKGNAKSIEYCVKLLLHAQNISKDYNLELDSKEMIIKLYIPAELTDIILLKDVFEYILPSGWVYEIYRAESSYNPETNIAVTNIYSRKDYSLYTSNRVTEVGVNDDMTGSTSGITTIGTVYGYSENMEPKELGKNEKAKKTTRSKLSRLQQPTNL